MEKSRCISRWTLQCAMVHMFSVRMADESAGSEPCWFWQTEYIQYNYSAVVSSYVTRVRSRGRTNIKPQDPGEPKEPFGLVPPPPFSSSCLLLSFFFLDYPHPPLSPFSLLFFHPPSSLAYILSLSSLSLSSPCYLPFPLLLFKSNYLASKVSNLFPRTPSPTPELPLSLCLFYHSGLLDSSPCTDGHAPQRRIPQM